MCIRDRNVGAPGVDEPALMEQVVKALQSVVSLPLQLDSSHAEALERGLRVYNCLLYTSLLPQEDRQHEKIKRRRRAAHEPDDRLYPAVLPAGADAPRAVSYTHLDVYKRQARCCRWRRR